MKQILVLLFIIISILHEKGTEKQSDWLKTTQLVIEMGFEPNHIGWQSPRLWSASTIMFYSKIPWAL